MLALRRLGASLRLARPVRPLTTSEPADALPDQPTPPEPAPVSLAGKPTSYATGRRKSSVARVWVEPGGSEVLVNGKTLEQFYSGLPWNVDEVLMPLVETGAQKLVGVKSTVKGGGTSGQAGALRLGISRALVGLDPELRPKLRAAGLLTRDSRRVERKKPGQKKARKKFQWVKR